MATSTKRGNRRASSSPSPSPKITEGKLPTVKSTSAQPPQPVPAYARVGMAVEFMWECTGPFYGVIRSVHQDGCMVRMDKTRGEGGEDDPNGEIPNVVALEWCDVLLTNVQPSRDEIAEPVKCVVKPGMRCEIGIGDGNNDRLATVLLALPECCVVRLDVPLEYGGSHHAAADWSEITLRNLGPEDGVNRGK